MAARNTGSQQVPAPDCYKSISSGTTKRPLLYFLGGGTKNDYFEWAPKSAPQAPSNSSPPYQITADGEAHTFFSLLFRMPQFTHARTLKPPTPAVVVHHIGDSPLGPVFAPDLLVWSSHRPLQRPTVAGLAPQGVTAGAVS
jgi:hypothetical protein